LRSDGEHFSNRYAAFVASNVPPTDYTALMPPVGTLCSTCDAGRFNPWVTRQSGLLARRAGLSGSARWTEDADLLYRYGLEPEIAFFICRPALAHLDAKEAKLAAEAKKAVVETTREAREAKGKPEAAEKEKAKEAAKLRAAEATKSDDGSSALTTQNIRAVLPAASWELLSPLMYSTFWSISLYDIFVPRQRYDAEVKRLRRQIDEIDRWMPPIGGEMGDIKANASKRKRDKERCHGNIERLKVELSQQIVRHDQVASRLQRGKAEWFATVKDKPEDKASAGETLNLFLQHCIFPRSVFSPADAVFCAKFVQHMHSQGTPFFSTLQYYDKLLRDISVHIFCCTERQAANLGHFLKESLSLLLHWKSDESVYKEECAKLPGFSVTFKDSGKEAGKKASYEDFVKVVFKW
jgi:THO complex subunit 2